MNTLGKLARSLSPNRSKKGKTAEAPGAGDDGPAERTEDSTHADAPGYGGFTPSSIAVPAGSYSSLGEQGTMAPFFVKEGVDVSPVLMGAADLEDPDVPDIDDKTDDYMSATIGVLDLEELRDKTTLPLPHERVPKLPVHAHQPSSPQLDHAHAAKQGPSEVVVGPNPCPSTTTTTPWGAVRGLSVGVRRGFGLNGGGGAAQDHGQSSLGLGIVVGVHPTGHLYIKLLIPGQPAAQNGMLQEGDVLGREISVRLCIASGEKSHQSQSQHPTPAQAHQPQRQWQPKHPMPSPHESLDSESLAPSASQLEHVLSSFQGQQSSEKSQLSGSVPMTVQPHGPLNVNSPSDRESLESWDPLNVNNKIRHPPPPPPASPGSSGPGHSDIDQVSPSPRQENAIDPLKNSARGETPEGHKSLAPTGADNYTYVNEVPIEVRPGMVAERQGLEQQCLPLSRGLGAGADVQRQEHVTAAGRAGSDSSEREKLAQEKLIYLEAERQRAIEHKRELERGMMLEVQNHELQSQVQVGVDEIKRLQSILREQESQCQKEKHELHKLRAEMQANGSVHREANQELARLQEESQLAAVDLAQLRAENGRLVDENGRLRSDVLALCSQPTLPATIPSIQHQEKETVGSDGTRVVLDDHIVIAGMVEGEGNGGNLDSSPGAGQRTPARRTRSNPGIGHDESPHDCPSKNQDLCLVPELRAMTDWRGVKAVPRHHHVYVLARTVVERAGEMMDALDMTDDMPDSSWNVTGHCLNDLLCATSYQDAMQKFDSIATFCEKVLRQEPPCIDVKPPCKVFGDIHGQFRDLLLLFREFGFPSHRRGDVEYVNYIFNGDFVDRGAHQLECVSLLFALKCLYPNQITLLRGNHEFREQNESMGDTGFWGACHSHLRDANLALQFYDRTHQVFDWLPLSAVVNRSILVVHGGIGDGNFTLEQLRSVERPIRTWTTNRFIEHVLWSDPSDSDSVMKMGVHGSPRGETCIEFGPDVTARFCEQNDLKMIIRAHQYVDHGYKIMHSGQLLTVFSARNYLDLQSNDSAVLLIAYDSDGCMRIRPKRLMHRAGHFQPAPSFGSPALEPLQPFQQAVPQMPSGVEWGHPVGGNTFHAQGSNTGQGPQRIAPIRWFAQAGFSPSDGNVYGGGNGVHAGSFVPHGQVNGQGSPGMYPQGVMSRISREAAGPRAASRGLVFHDHMGYE